jgi:hypothetical protein
MRAYAQIVPTFWTRGSGKKLRGKPIAQTLALYLLTAPASNMIGLYYLPLTTLCAETGLTTEQIKQALPDVEEIAKYDTEAELVWVPECAAHQIGETMGTKDKKRSAVIRELDMAGKHRFVTEFMARYAVAYGLSPCGVLPPAPQKTEGLPANQEGASTTTDAPLSCSIPDPDPVGGTGGEAKPVEPTPDLVKRAQSVLDNPFDGEFKQPSKWPEVQVVAKAWSEPFGIRKIKLRDNPNSDADLKAILTAFAGEFTVDDCLAAATRTQGNQWFSSLKSPGPACFTVTVLRRLLQDSDANKPAKATFIPGKGYV